MAAAPALTCAFHSSAVFGITFQVGGGGAPMIFCICGLTVSGTGTLCAGTSRVPGAAVWAKAAVAATTIAPTKGPSAHENPAMSREAAELRVILISSRLSACVLGEVGAAIYLTLPPAGREHVGWVEHLRNPSIDMSGR